MDDYFETILFVDDTVYDPQNKALSLFVTIILTGEKKVLVQSKNDYRYKNSEYGDFPDSEMYKFAENLKGKKIKWRMYNDPNVKKATEADIREMVEKSKEHVEGIGNILFDEDRVVERRKENLIRLQQEARRRIARENQ